MIESTISIAWCLVAGFVEPPPIVLSDATQSSGVAVSNVSGKSPSSHILEVKGGGLALIDFDGDGDEDLFVPSGATLDDPEHGPGGRLFENMGSLQFRDVTANMGANPTRWSFGVAVGDYDSDGRDDLFIATFGPDILLRNLGGGKFEVAGDGVLPSDNDWNTGAAFADFDEDGDLDLYVCGYVKCDPMNPLPSARFKDQLVISGPRGYEAVQDRILENVDGHFVDRSVESGIAAMPHRYALNAIAADFTGDGLVDLFVGNDSQPDSLLVNLGGLRFEDRGLPSGVATNLDGHSQATMGIAYGDVDGNGFPDLITTVFSSDTNTLHLNLDGRFFDDRTAQYGIGGPSTTLCGWGASLADLDHDGDEDLLIVNGHVYPQATKSLMESDYRQPILLMRRDAKRFVAVEADPHQDPSLNAHVDRSLVMTDLDGDLDLDAVVSELNGPVRVIRNDHPRAADAIVVEVIDDQNRGNRHAIGSILDLFSPDGSRIARRWIVGGGPFQSNASSRVHFGIAPEFRQLDLTVKVTLPDGVVVKKHVRAGDRVTVVRARESATEGAKEVQPTLP
ncbi:MAG: CRTAC1 family protein [Planctomycetota bacterium]|nr:CRTAC1 family protein [Planctomycetota bacterium]